jgi:molybdopterin synthase catalytic subunit
MRATVLLFASVADALGTRRLELPLYEGDTIATARDRLVSDYPALARDVPNLMDAIDETYAKETDALRDGATLALIPPVSGG